MLPKAHYCIIYYANHTILIYHPPIIQENSLSTKAAAPVNYCIRVLMCKCVGLEGEHN